MRESDLKVMSRGCCPCRPDLGASIVFPDWWYRLMRLTVMQEQRNDLAMRVTLVPVDNMSKALLRLF